MSDLISRQAAIDAMFAKMPGLTFGDILQILHELPSAQPKSYREGYQAGFKDAQPEVIRCGECKCWRELPNGCQGFCDMHSTYPTLTDFCSWAERREDNK